MNDPYIDTAEKALFGLSAAAIPGAFLVDTFPILKNVPSWFPGAQFQRRAKEWHDLAQKMVEVPFAAVKQNIVRLISSVLQSQSFINFCCILFLAGRHRGTFVHFVLYREYRSQQRCCLSRTTHSGDCCELVHWYVQYIHDTDGSILLIQRCVCDTAGSDTVRHFPLTHKSQ